MPTFTFSRKSNYWRPQCRNKLRGETSNPRSYAIPCEVCVYPTDMPPVRNCWCTPELRPQGMSSSMTLTLPSALGADTATSAFTSQTQVFTYTNAGITGVPDATMIPADGVKTTTVTYTRERDYTSATGTSFIAKHLPTYLPSVPGISDRNCEWIALAGAQYVERSYHPTIVGSNTSKSWSFQQGGVTVNRLFNDFNILQAHAVNKRTIALDNNDPASIMAVHEPRPTTGYTNYYDFLRAYVPQISAGMPADMGRPCHPTACNISCYPVDPYCYTHRYNEILTRSGVQAIQFSWWQYVAKTSGYFWIISQVPNPGSATQTNCWMAKLMYKSGEDILPFSGSRIGSFLTLTHVKPKPSTSLTVGGSNVYHTTSDLRGVIEYNGSIGLKSQWFYPQSYHNAIPTITYMDRSDNFRSSPGSNRALLQEEIPSVIGTARHPAWPGTVPSLTFSSSSPACLAVYATAPLACNFTGTASMLRIADYRTAPNRPPGAINAGPSSFPATATLTF
jgi:hypothetical protein